MIASQSQHRIAATFACALSGWCASFAVAADAPSNGADGDGSVRVSGELEQWHVVTLTVAGPFARETDDDPNPFADFRLEVRFSHASGAPIHTVPGYFAADGDAANTSATSGTAWRAHLSPDEAGSWTYRISFVRGKGVALDPRAAGVPVAWIDGKTGSFEVRPTGKSGRDFRGKGRLLWGGSHHLHFAGTREPFLKAGADSPENLLAFFEFDGTVSHKSTPREGEARSAGLHRYEPHAGDWRPGDPTWRGGKGKNLIGALNYLASKGCNSVSFLTYNAGGDGDDVWPFASRDDKLHFDCSKLDQWRIAFDHAQTIGLHLHFKLQETEIDDDRPGGDGKVRRVPESLDGGKLGPERKLYLRELIARFSHEPGLTWNLGEENTQTPDEQTAMARWIHDLDTYSHLIVVHTYPDWQDKVYTALLGRQSRLTGASLQNSWSDAHRRVRLWVSASAGAGWPWVVSNDEQNPAGLGVPPDPGYRGHDGVARGGGRPYDLHDIRKQTLWGTLMAGGAGVEYYFGYELPQNDLRCEDWRSRDRSWDYCRIALDFFSDHHVPFDEMSSADRLVGNPEGLPTAWCLAKPGSIYLVYLVRGGTADLDLGGVDGDFSVRWLDPRQGGALLEGDVKTVRGGGKASIGTPPREAKEDWLAVVRR